MDSRVMHSELTSPFGRMGSAMPTLDATPYHQVRYKASHNSYDRTMSLEDQLRFDPNAPWECGCRGLELDLSQVPRDAKSWDVKHDPGAREPAHPFKKYLADLLKWSAGAKNHVPVTVVLDLKRVNSSEQAFPGRLDTYIRDHFDASSLFRPKDFWDDAGGQWPTIKELRGKFLFVLSGAGIKNVYPREASAPEPRLCFVDRGMPRDPGGMKLRKFSRVFINMDRKSMGRTSMKKWLKQAARHPQFCIRLYGLNGRSMWNSATEHGVNMMATDAMTGEDWATVVPVGAADPMMAFTPP